MRIPPSLRPGAALLLRLGSPHYCPPVSSLPPSRSVWTKPLLPAPSPLERALLAGGAAVASLVDPGRGDTVGLLAELTGGPAVRALHHKLASTPTGAALLAGSPRLTTDTLDLPFLRALPPSTLGRAYMDHLDGHGFSPDGRAEVVLLGTPAPGDPPPHELRWVMQRYREVHDVWHVLCGLPPTLLGETALKWFEMVQTGLPSTAAAAFAAPARLHPAQRRALWRVFVPWAVSSGKGAVFLLGVRVEDLWEVPLEEVQRELRVVPAPKWEGE